jgi:hypothetical protein
MRIAGNNTDKDWIALKARLQSEPNERLWDAAYWRFYRMRIDTRYIYPIASIEEHDSERGEGFAITALFCSLIEFLESCEKGDNFDLYANGNDTPQSHKYNSHQAKSYFKEFLKTRTPFDKLIPSTLVDSFYQDVRCALLHEARTKGGWYISSAPSSGVLILQKGGRINLFRDQLIPALKKYFLDYRSRLLVNSSVQEAFIRKFNHLCQT